MGTFIKISAWIAFLAGLIAAVLMGLLGPGYQSSWWSFMFVYTKGFKIVVVLGLLAATLGLLHVITSLIGKKRVAGMAIIGLLLGAGAAAVPLQMKRISSSVPKIHDITTDVNNPPSFVDIVPLRADASNPVTYDPAVSVKQLEAYPDIKTLTINASLAEVKQMSLDVVESLGWELVSGNSDTRIEATHTTQWFGFKDDVVIRLTPNGDQVKVDVRSKSRVGLSDLGANASRVRKFINALKK